MPYQMQSNDTGAVFDFEDSVPLPRAAAYIRASERQPTYEEVIGKGIQNIGPATSARAAQLDAGILRAAGDITRNPEWVRQAELVQNTAAEDLAAMQPRNMSWTQEGVYSGVTQLPENFLYLASGALGGLLRAGTVGREALAGMEGLSSAEKASLLASEAYKGARVGLLPMAGSEAFQHYGESRAGGQEVPGAVAGSLVHGAAEYFGEIYSAKPMAEILVGGPGHALMNKLLEFFAREVGGEEFTTIVEGMNDAVRDGKTFGEWAHSLPKDLYTTAVSTAVSGGLQTGTLGGISKLADAKLPQAAPPITPTTAPLVTPPTTPPVTPPVTPPTPPAPVDLSGLPKDSEVQKTHNGPPLVLDPETGKFVPANTLDISRQELPFDQRIELLRIAKSHTDTALAQLSELERAANATTSVGFNATAEEVITARKQKQSAIDTLRAQAEDIQRQYNEQQEKVVQEIKDNPTLMAHVATSDFVDGVLSGTLPDAMTVSLLQAAAGQDVAASVEAITERAVRNGIVPPSVLSDVKGTPQFSASETQTIDQLSQESAGNIPATTSSPEKAFARASSYINALTGRNEQAVSFWQDDTVVADSIASTASPLLGKLGKDAIDKLAPGQVIATLPAVDLKNPAQKAATTALNNERIASEHVDTLASLLRTFAPHLSVILGYRDDETEGSAVRPFTRNTYIVDLPLSLIGPPKFSSLLPQSIVSLYNKWNTMLTIAHEFGHILHLDAVNTATLEERRALGTAYFEELKRVMNGSFHDGLLRLFGPSRGAAALVNAKEHADVRKVSLPKLIDAPFLESYKRLSWETWGPYPHYILSANEWFAEQMVKYVARRGGVTPELNSLFQRTAFKLAAVYRNFVAPAVRALKQLADDLRKANPDAVFKGPTTTSALVDALVKENATFGAFMDSLVRKYADTASVVSAEQTKLTPLGMLGSDFKVAGQNALSLTKLAELHREYLQKLQRGTKYSRYHVEALAKELQPVFARLRNVHGKISADTLFARIKGQVQSSPYTDAVMESLRLMLQEPQFSKPFALSTFWPRFLRDVLNMKEVRVTNSQSPGLFTASVTFQHPYPGLTSTVRIGQFVVSRVRESNIAELHETSAGIEMEDFATAMLGMQQAAELGAKYIDITALSPAVRGLLTTFASETIARKDGTTIIQLPRWAYGDTPTQAHGMPLHDVMANLGAVFGVPAMSNFAHATARFNKLMEYSLGAFQIFKKNMHVPGIPETKQAFLNRMGFRAEWQRMANQTLRAWTNLPKDQANKIAKILLDETEAYEAALTPQQKLAAWRSVRRPDPANPGRSLYVLSQNAIQTYGVTQEAAEVYSQIRGDFQEFLDELHKVGLYEIADIQLGRVPALTLQSAIQKKVTLTELGILLDSFVASVTDPAKVQTIASQRQELMQQYTALAEKPYTPFARFGQWGVLVKRPADKKTVYFATFESQQEQLAHAQELAKDPRFAGLGVSTTYIEDLPYSVAGLPPMVAASLKARLNLSVAQAKELDEVVASYMSANTFARKMGKRHGVEGYSNDVMRGYADYFRKGAIYITNTKSRMEMADALGILRKYIQDVQNQPGFHDTRKLSRLHEWVEKTFDYVMHPDSEPGALKSFVSLFHFGFNVSSAFVNMMQVPMVTLPYLAERYGWKNALTQLRQAYTDVTNFRGWAQLPAEEQAMVEYGLSQGSFDESLAMTVAQLADGYYLTRSNVGTATRRTLNKLNHTALWMFRTAEELNRRVSALAAYRLGRDSSRLSQHSTGVFDMEAYEHALDTVQDTQGEYSIENRPKFMRGNLSLVFQFMQFSQNMTFQMFGGDKSWKKLMLIQLAMAGVMGLPFGSDAAELIKLLGRLWFGKNWDVKYEIREYLKDSAINSDLVLNGVSSDVFGFDLSQRLSLGDLVPGLKAVASHRKFNDVMYDATGDIGGPGISLMLNVMRFIGEDDPRLLHRYQAIAPSALRNILRGVETEVNQGVRDRDGALLYEPTIWQLAGYTAGFLPAELGDKYAARTAIQEAATFWTNRRASLLEEVRYILLQKGGDREALSDALAAIAKYNQEVPDPKLMISRKTLVSSVKNEAKSVVRREAGFGTNPQTRIMSSQMSQAF